MKLRDDISKAFREPWKFRRYLGILARSIPFRSRLARLIPRGHHLAYAPDRFVTNLSKYESDPGVFERGNVAMWLKGNSENLGDMARYYFLNLTCDQILKENLNGDIAELGVYKGNTAFLLARLAREMGSTLYLFDTFEGFDERDFSGVDSGKSAAFADTSIESVKKLVGGQNVRCVSGYFPDSLAQLDVEPTFALVHIDCDLYAPAKAALEYFYPRMVAGGWLLIHDYSSLVWEGIEKAVDEFLADKPERLVLIPDKAGTAVIRKAAVI